MASLDCFYGILANYIIFIIGGCIESERIYPDQINHQPTMPHCLTFLLSSCLICLGSPINFSMWSAEICSVYFSKQQNFYANLTREIRRETLEHTQYILYRYVKTKKVFDLTWKRFEIFKDSFVVICVVFFGWLVCLDFLARRFGRVIQCCIDLSKLSSCQYVDNEWVKLKIINEMKDFLRKIAQNTVFFNVMKQA